MTVSVDLLHVQIERVVHRDSRLPDAEFFHLRPTGRWLAAQAWITDRGPRLAGRGGELTFEDASIVRVAMQMAQDWLIEELKL